MVLTSCRLKKMEIIHSKTVINVHSSCCARNVVSNVLALTSFSLSLLSLFLSMNMFKHLVQGEKADAGDASTEHRQQRVWALDVPRSVTDVAKILGDIEGNKDGFPIYRKITLTTLIVSEKTKELMIWIDANPSTGGSPDIVWNLTSLVRVDAGV